MDTLTQAALGAAIGEAGFRSRLGGRAVVFGAICGLVPDLDVLFRVAGPWASLEYHRGVTHSVLALPLFAVPVGWMGCRFLGKSSELMTWVHLAFWALITHPLLDTCTSYGTQLLAPFSDRRFSTDALGIIDLLYSVPLFASCWASRWGSDALRRRMSRGALVVSTLYAVMAHVWSAQAREMASTSLSQMGVEVVQLRTPPPPIFSGLRRMVAVDSEGTIWAANVSVWFPRELSWVTIDGANDPRIDALMKTDEGRIFEWFADGYARAEWLDERTVVVRDHRYGMFSDLRWTPFTMRAERNESGAFKRIELQQRGDGVDMAEEMSIGWQQMWGR